MAIFHKTELAQSEVYWDKWNAWNIIANSREKKIVLNEMFHHRHVCICVLNR